MNLSALINNINAALQLNGNSVSSTNPLPITSGQAQYVAGDGRVIPPVSSLGILFSDDFGGVALDTTVRWNVIDGGLPANPTLNGNTLTQGAIGSGVAMGNGVNGNTNSALAVSNSVLTVNMGTTASAELWILSQQVFSCTEDVTILLGKSQALSQNSIWAQMVEVNPATGIPLLNPYLANDFTNRAGVEFGTTTTNTAAYLQAVGDSSPVVAQTSQTAFAPAAMTTAFETTIEYHAEDTIASSTVADGIAGKTPNALRLSSQVPNDGRAYKLLLRFKNIGAPASNTTVSILRVLVVDGQEMRVEVASGRGDTIPQKAIATNITNPSSSPANVAVDSVTDSYTVTATVTSVTTLMTLNTAGFGMACVAYTSAAGNIEWQISNDNVNWYSVQSTSNQANTSSTGMYWIPLFAQYFRVLNTTYTSGNLTVTVTLKRATGTVFPGGGTITASVTQGGTSSWNVTAMSGFSDSTTALVANAVFTGTSRSFNTSEAIFSRFNYYAYSDQSGSLQIQVSYNTGTTWYPYGPPVPLTGGTPINGTAVVTGLSAASLLYRVVYTNGATAQTQFALSTSITPS
jgi:hypothetical protein